MLCLSVALSITDASFATEAKAETIHDVVAATWEDPAEWETAEQIAYHESRGVANAYNEYSAAYGMFQFLPSTAFYEGFDYASLADPYYCSWAAAQLQDRYGWTPWVTYGYYTPGAGYTEISYY